MWRGYCIKKNISSKLVCFRQYKHTAIVEAPLPVGKTKQIIRKCTDNGFELSESNGV